MIARSGTTALPLLSLLHSNLFERSHLAQKPNFALHRVGFALKEIGEFLEADAGFHA